MCLRVLCNFFFLNDSRPDRLRRVKKYCKICQIVFKRRLALFLGSFVGVRLLVRLRSLVSRFPLISAFRIRFSFLNRPSTLSPWQARTRNHGGGQSVMVRVDAVVGHSTSLLVALFACGVSFGIYARSRVLVWGPWFFFFFWWV